MNLQTLPTPTRTVFQVLAVGALISLALPSFAAESSCIVAGRVNDAQQWAPLLPGVTLLDAKGARVAGASPAALATVAKVKVSRAALLSNCEAKSGLAEGGEPQAKSAVPAVKAGPVALAVVAVNFPKMRTGGELVELQLAVPPERRIQVTR